MQLLLGFIGCKNSDMKKETEHSKDRETTTLSESEEELYRPNFHFSPKKGWMNDPNGMFYYNNYYHLYFQHYPDDNVWGPMHWGHAISTDMVTWKEQPIALYPDELGYIYSGSAVVDIENTSGFGKDGKVPIIAMFTSHDPKKAEAKQIDVETQSIAYSVDEGLTWTKYAGNPIIKNQGVRDFRDPKVSWDEVHNQWNMVLAAGQRTYFYSSSNLKDWTLLSTFGEGIGNHNGVWECPDLFPLKVQGSDVTKWVHLVSINPGGPNGGSATQYFVGDFDGAVFKVDKAFEASMKKEHDFWVDFGKDNYAGVTWSNITTSNDAKLFIGWMSNWQYANQVPTTAWRSATTIPREIRLTRLDGTYRLTFTPTNELLRYRGKKYKKEDILIQRNTKLVDSKTIDLARAEIIFKIDALEDRNFKYKLSNDHGDELSFGYKNKDQSFYVDRTNSGKVNFSTEFAKKISSAPRISKASSLTGRILLDKTSIEIFYDNGITVMSEIFFPHQPFESLSIDSDKELTLEYLEIHELNFN